MTTCLNLVPEDLAFTGNKQQKIKFESNCGIIIYHNDNVHQQFKVGKSIQYTLH